MSVFLRISKISQSVILLNILVCVEELKLHERLNKKLSWGQGRVTSAPSTFCTECPYTWNSTLNIVKLEGVTSIRYLLTHF